MPAGRGDSDRVPAKREGEALDAGARSGPLRAKGHSLAAFESYLHGPTVAAVCECGERLTCRTQRIGRKKHETHKLDVLAREARDR